ncbi:MAG: hypothetical protein ACJZ10_04855 [Candidatus Neomarinimicrobiota bacterium]
MKIPLNNKNLINIAFLSLFSVGIYFAKDFGISYDETWHRNHGKSTLAFLARLFGIDKILGSVEHISDLDTFGYSALFEMFFILIEKSLFIEDTRDIYILRHALNFTIYIFGAYMFFLFIREHTQNLSISFIVSMFYLINPRLLGHGFFNCKDSIAQALVACSLLPLYLAFKTSNRNSFIISGIIIGLSIVVRVPIIYLPFIYLIALFAKDFDAKKKYFFAKSTFSNILIFFLSIFFSAFVFQPVFWGISFNDIKKIFLSFMEFPWDGFNYYLGHYISSRNLPWHYIPLWVLITTPLSFIIFFFFGISTTFRKSLKRFRKNMFFDFFMLMGFIVPIFVIIILNSTLYDGWRHMFFIYPFLSYFMGVGFIWSINYLKYKFSLTFRKIMIIIPVLTFLSPIVKTIQLHPYQNVFFNSLAGRDPMKYFEGDYWALSMREGIEWILKNDDNERIWIASNYNMAKINYPIIKKNDRKRLAWLYMEHHHDSTATLRPTVLDMKADYYITNFRWAGSDYKKLKDHTFPPYENELFSIEKGNMKILGIYEYTVQN